MRTAGHCPGSGVEHSKKCSTSPSNVNFDWYSIFPWSHSGASPAHGGAFTLPGG